MFSEGYPGDTFIQDLAAGGSNLLASRDTSGGAGTATALLEINGDGRVRTAKNANNSDTVPPLDTVGNTPWYIGAPVVGAGDDYELYSTVSNSYSGEGTLTAVGLDSWQPLLTQESFELTDSGNNIEKFAARDIDFTIRNKITLEVLSTVTIHMQAYLFGP